MVLVAKNLEHKSWIEWNRRYLYLVTTVPALEHAGPGLVPGSESVTLQTYSA